MTDSNEAVFLANYSLIVKANFTLMNSAAKGTAGK